MIGFTYLTFREFEPDVLFRALIISIFVPVLFAFPAIYISFSHYAKAQKLTKIIELKEIELGEFIHIMPDIITRSDPDMNITFANKMYSDIVGKDIDYILGKKFTEFIDQSSFDEVINCIASLTPDEPIQSHKQFHINPDGSECWIYWTNLMRFDLQDNPIEILSIGKDITELQFAHQKIEAQAAKLEQANLSLELANQELNQFSSIASHDLQEPLRKISFFSDILADALLENDGETVEYALQVLSKSAIRGRTLVANLLTLSRTSNQPVELRQIDISEVIESVISDLSVVIKQTGTQIINDLTEIEVYGDWQITSEIFLNLLQNAIKFRQVDQDPVIHLYAAEKMGGKILITVKDNGIGFSAEHERNIFKAFQRLHSRDVYDGTGIGLAIVSTAARRQGWNVYATSEPKQGSTFIVEIPTGQQELAEIQEQEILRKVLTSGTSLE